MEKPKKVKRKLTARQRLLRKIRNLEEEVDDRRKSDKKDCLRSRQLPDPLIDFVAHYGEVLNEPVMIGLADGRVFECTMIEFVHWHYSFDKSIESRDDWLQLKGRLVVPNFAAPYASSEKFPTWRIYIRLSAIVWFALKPEEKKA